MQSIFNKPLLTSLIYLLLSAFNTATQANELEKMPANSSMQAAAEISSLQPDYAQQHTMLLQNLVIAQKKCLSTFLINACLDEKKQRYHHENDALEAKAIRHMQQQRQQAYIKKMELQAFEAQTSSQENAAQILENQKKFQEKTAKLYAQQASTNVTYAMNGQILPIFERMPMQPFTLPATPSINESAAVVHAQATQTHTLLAADKMQKQANTALLAQQKHQKNTLKAVATTENLAQRIKRLDAFVEQYKTP